MGPDVLEYRESISARIFEREARPIGNLERTAVGSPSAFLEDAGGLLEILDLEDRHAARGGSMIREQEEWAFTDAKCGDVGIEPGEVPYEFCPENIAVAGEVAIKVRGAHVEI